MDTPQRDAEIAASVLDALPELITRYRRDDRKIVYANAAKAAFHGLPRDDLIGRSLDELLTAPQLDDLLGQLAAFSADPPEQDRPVLRAVSGDTDRWIEWWDRAMPGTDAREVLSVGRDVTEQHRAIRALHASERRFRHAMDHAPIGMALSDLDGNWQAVNDAMCDFFGRPREDLSGRVVDVVTHPDDLEVSHQRIRQLSEQRCSSYTLEKRYLHADGDVLWGEVTVTLVRDDDGTPLYHIAQIVDVTARKAVEERLERTIAELVDSNRRLSDFAGIVSHDLKSPISALTGLLTLIRDHHGPALSDDARDWLSRARSQALRLGGTVDALLDLSSVTRTAPRPSDVDVSSVLAEVTQALRVELDHAGARIVAGRLADLRGDRTQLSLLLQNLLGNALRFRDPARSLVVHVHTEVDGDRWTLTVEDNGVGFAPEDAERIFELFARSHDGRRFEGSGIGLATCRRIAERHGGTIRAGVNDAGGATFVVELPVDGPG